MKNNTITINIDLSFESGDVISSFYCNIIFDRYTDN